MLPPYQCLQQCGGVLLAATLSRLDSYSIADGLRLSSWTCPTSEEENSGSNSQSLEENDFEPFPKRRRLSNLYDAEETMAGKVAGYEIKQPVVSVGKQEAPAVIALASTRRGDHVIVVTGEDKSIRVFEHDGRGQLRQISQRVMPKRPCAVALTADETTLLCADKFGDVYSIPLLVSNSPAGPKLQEESTETICPVAKPSKPFVPAANDLTVHSSRNRRALQNQMKQKHSNSQKSEPHFERKLLLGHVSMLTDIAVVERNEQNYIITADRDEHIRISRGIPQAHIIEGYCLGHKDFVSQLCLPAGQPNLLISGGGDDEIFVWDWSLGKLLHKISLRSHVEEVVLGFHHGLHINAKIESNETLPVEPVRVAVSNIQHMAEPSGQQDDLIMVICEGVPALFIFSLLEDFTLSHYQTLRFEGNPLGLILDSGLKSMTVSIDTVHEGGSTFQLRNYLNSTVQPLQNFQEVDREWVKGPLQFNIGSKAAPPLSGSDKNGGRNLAELLYPIQKLRKIGGED